MVYYTISLLKIVGRFDKPLRFFPLFFVLFRHFRSSAEAFALRQVPAKIPNSGTDTLHSRPVF